MDLAPNTVRNALNCKLCNDLIRLTPKFHDQSDWAKFGLLLGQYLPVVRTISTSLYERLDPDGRAEFLKWFLLRWAQVDVLERQERDEYEEKWNSTKSYNYNWSVRTIEGKRHVVVDLRDVYDFQLVYDGAYKTIDDGAWILCDFLLNPYHFKEFSVQKGDVILDIGAYIGDTALLLSRMTHGDCAIHSFEISPPNYDVLLKNIAYNKLDHIHAHRLAVYGSSNMKLEFGHSRAKTSLLSGPANRGGAYTVNTVTIDDYVTQHSLNRVDFIKMDIEGAEMEALKGAVKTIKMFRPRLAISIYHLWSDVYEIPRFISELCPEYDYGFNWYGKRNGNDALLYACIGIKPEVTLCANDEMIPATIDEVVYRSLFSSYDFHQAVEAEHNGEIVSQIDRFKQSRSYRVAQALSLPVRAMRKVRSNGIRWMMERVLRMVRGDDARAVKR